MILKQNSKIKAIGKYWKIDRNGCVVNDASTSKIQKRWQPVVKETKSAYINYFGNDLKSIYIRGSVARGVAREYISDLDTIAFVSLPNSKIDLSWAKDFNNYIKNEYPFVTRVEIIVDPEKEAYTNAGNKIILKTQSVCIYGNDLAKNIESFRINRSLVQHAFSLKKDIDRTLKRMKSDQSEKIKSICLSINETSGKNWI